MVLFLQYIGWHYGRGFRDLLRFWINMLWFFYTFFSIPLLVASLFSPWHRLRESYTDKKEIGDMVGDFFMNVILRAVGFFVRIGCIATGFLFLSAALVGGALSFALWVLLPLFVVAGLAVGVSFLL